MIEVAEELELHPVVYSTEMDQETRKVLNEIPNKIVEGLSRSLRDISIASASPPKSETFSWQKVLATTVSILAIVAAFWSGFSYIISSELKKAFEQPNREFASLRDKDFGSVQKDIQYLRRDVDRMLDQQARQILTGKEAIKPKVAVVDDIKDAAIRARERRIIVDPTAIQKVSKLVMSSQDREAWDAILELVNLRSFVNSTLEYAKQHVVLTIEPKALDIRFPMVKPGQWVEFVHAHLKLDGKPGENGFLADDKGRPLTPITNIIVRGSTVEYRGGHATLVNVFFEDCIFEITNNNNGRLMAIAVLKPAPFTSFAAD